MLVETFGWAFCLYTVTIPIPFAAGSCPPGARHNLDLNVVFLISGDLAFPTAFDKFRAEIDPLPKCVKVTLANVDIWRDLELPDKGWTKIQSELIKHGRSTQIETHVVIGPYYLNLAMMLEQLNVTYLVTASKGYDWTDMSRIDDDINWGTMVELIPPPRDQNRAVVDLFLSKNWENAIMIMPDELDNEECKDLAHQMIDNQVSLIPFSIPEDSAEEMIKTVLQNSELLSQRRIIICSPRDDVDNLIFKVLSQAKKFNMFDKEELVFVIVDPYSLLQALSGMNNTFKLGLFGVRAQLLSFRYVHPKMELMEPYHATASDSARVIGRAVEDYFLWSKSSAVGDDFSSLKLLSYIKKVALYGETGWVQFDQKGKRTDYKLYLYRHGGENLFQRIGEWSKDQKNDLEPRMKFAEAVSIDKPAVDMGIFPPVVRVAVVLDEPFVMRKEGHNGRRYAGKSPYEGFSIDLLRRLSKDLHFNYEVYEAPNNSYGARAEDGTWDGMVGEIISKRATFALGALSISSSREDVIDFTHGIMTSGSNILVPKPRETLSIFQFLKPFSPTLWYAIITAFFTLCAMFYILDCQTSPRKFTVKECLWFCLGVLLMRGTDFSPKSTPQRILTTGYIFFALISVSTYTANMAAFLTRINLNTEVSTFEDLLHSDELVPLTVSNSSTMFYLKGQKEGVLKSLWDKIVFQNGIVPNAKEAIDLVRQGGHALIFDYHINSFAEQHVCETMAVGLPVLRLEHGLGIPAGASYKRLLDIAILKLQESGYINTLVDKWWAERRRCDRKGEKKSSREAHFQITHMAGIFIVGVGGLVLSVLCFIMKKLYLCCTATKSEPGDVAPESEREARFSEVFGFRAPDKTDQD